MKFGTTIEKRLSTAVTAIARRLLNMSLPELRKAVLARVEFEEPQDTDNHVCDAVMLRLDLTTTPTGAYRSMQLALATDADMRDHPELAKFKSGKEIDAGYVCVPVPLLMRRGVTESEIAHRIDGATREALALALELRKLEAKHVV